MEWDDSGMNITVNPLDEVGKNAIGYTNEEESSDEAERYSRKIQLLKMNLHRDKCYCTEHLG